MGKILIWLMAAIAGLIFYKAVKSRQQADKHDRDQQAMNNQPIHDGELKHKTEAMVLCGVCGVHLPASETQSKNGIISCSQSHTCGKQAN